MSRSPQVEENINVKSLAKVSERVCHNMLLPMSHRAPPPVSDAFRCSPHGGWSGSRRAGQKHRRVDRGLHQQEREKGDSRGEPPHRTHICPRSPTLFPEPISPIMLHGFPGCPPSFPASPNIAHAACSHLFACLCLWQGISPRGFTPRTPPLTFWIHRRVFCSDPHLCGALRFLWRFRARACCAHAVWMLCTPASFRAVSRAPDAQICRQKLKCACTVLFGAWVMD